MRNIRLNKPTEEDFATVGAIEGKPKEVAAAHRMVILRNCWSRLDTSWQVWQEQLKEVIANKVWEFYPVNQPFGSLEALLEANGIEMVQALDRDQYQNRVARFNGHGGDRRSEGFQVDERQLEKAKGGNDVGYIEARIERDYPDIQKRWDAGEFKNARQAGIAAGFIKKDGRFYIPETPEEAGVFLAKKLKGDDEWMRAMVEAYENARDAALAKEISDGVDRGERETVPWEEVKAGSRKKGLL